MTTKKKDEMPDIPMADGRFDIENNGFWYQWCCGCGLRHILVLEVIRGKKSDQDKIRVRIADDPWATAARKKLNQKKKKKR